MQYQLSNDSAFQLVEITLQQNEEIKIERGSMVYHTGDVELQGKMNSNGASGLGGLIKAVGRGMASGESMFMTTAIGQRDGAKISLGPALPGKIMELTTSPANNWRLNTGSFLAADEGVNYNMKRQELGKAIFAGTGGLFIMETTGEGSLLIASYGDIVEMDVTDHLIVDNGNVLAWSSSLDYKLEIASGMFGFKSGEGIVNHFSGQGKVLVQTRNLKAMADSLIPYMPTGGSK
ncbi:TIGR00266 family protein [Periweissella cryptocerci]|uniref:TIGR00266 family protein n=1 Tax=Periweissella cryptocerci TaxID=2506420 RepID=A0A4P6YUM6_9LACO|nr:TIGR00266 family protein [Periweissella cryptocerci]QBO36488.1 TIGR00266 family protein [Periweissella cryptocerci]